MSSPDFDGLREIDPAGVPEGATTADQLLTPAERSDYLRQVEAESGESLVESA